MPGYYSIATGLATVGMVETAYLTFVSGRHGHLPGACAEATSCMLQVDTGSATQHNSPALQVKLFNAPLVCPASGCETVLTSSYSELFGVPLSFFGMLVYGAVGALSASAATQTAATGQQPQMQNMGLISGTAVLATVSSALL